MTPPLMSREYPALPNRLAWSARILPSDVNPTFQLTRKGCRWPVVWMSSQRSSIHRTGLLVFFAATATMAESYSDAIFSVRKRCLTETYMRWPRLFATKATSKTLASGNNTVSRNTSNLQRPCQCKIIYHRCETHLSNPALAVRQRLSGRKDLHFATLKFWNPIGESPLKSEGTPSSTRWNSHKTSHRLQVEVLHNKFSSMIINHRSR